MNPKLFFPEVPALSDELECPFISTIGHVPFSYFNCLSITFSSSLCECVHCGCAPLSWQYWVKIHCYLWMWRVCNLYLLKTLVTELGKVAAYETKCVTRPEDISSRGVFLYKVEGWLLLGIIVATDNLSTYKWAVSLLCETFKRLFSHYVIHVSLSVIALV